MTALKRLIVFCAVLALHCAPGASHAATSEYFLDTANIESSAGVAFGVNRPSKNAGNPLYPSGTNTHTWDQEKNGVVLARWDEGVIKMWVYPYNSVAAMTGTTYQYSEDGGITWQRPNLGLIAYDGNTNNNICTAGQLIGIQYDAINSRYVGVGDAWGGNLGVFLATSPDGINWTLAKTIHLQNNGGSADYTEGNAVVQRSDGTWVAYGIRGHSSEARSVVAWTSDTTDVTGAWTYQGAVLSAESATEQRYTIGLHVFDSGLMLANSSDYNSVTERMNDLQIYASRDGLAWTLLDAQWFTAGPAGAWDDSVIFHLSSVVNIDNESVIFYSGAGENHATFPRDARIGAVVIGKDRIGQVSGTGTVVSAIVLTPSPAYLHLNADASGGTIKAELLDSGGVVVPGYSQDDFDAFTESDTYNTVATWGGNNIPASGSYKIKFYLTDATVYSWAVNGSSAGTSMAAAATAARLANLGTAARLAALGAAGRTSNLQ